MIQTKTMLKEVGFVPVECVAVKGSIEALPFWFGNNSRMTVKVKRSYHNIRNSVSVSRDFFSLVKANDILSKSSITGTFLVRFSRTYGDSMALSVLFNGRAGLIKHYRIYYEDYEMHKLHEEPINKRSSICC